MISLPYSLSFTLWLVLGKVEEVLWWSGMLFSGRFGKIETGWFSLIRIATSLRPCSQLRCIHEIGFWQRLSRTIAFSMNVVQTRWNVCPEDRSFLVWLYFAFVGVSRMLYQGGDFDDPSFWFVVLVLSGVSCYVIHLLSFLSFWPRWVRRISRYMGFCVP